MPKTWLRERKKDYYYRKAKEEKYRSRAAYKLFQAVEKYHFITYHDVVVDLGAAPGGWMQASRKMVGGKGFVLGVDLEIIEQFPKNNVQSLIGDISEQETLEQILNTIPRKADAIISDASPNISGIWEIDHARQIDLAYQALKIALATLKPSGSFFVKVFQGDLLDDFIRKMKNEFETVRIIKPKASRTKSSEMYILGICLRGQTSRTTKIN